MAETVVSNLTFEEFLAFEGEGDTRYELVRGAVVAMAPPLVAHGTIVVNLGSRLRNALKPPCRAISEAGIKLPDRADTFYVADLVVTCAPQAKDSVMVEAPRLIAEVLSPSTAARDRGLKVPDYCTIPSVAEILLLSTDERRATLWRRDGPRWIVEDFIGSARFTLADLDVELALDELYADLDVQGAPRA